MKKAACRYSISACSRDGRTGEKEGANLVGLHLLASQHLNSQACYRHAPATYRSLIQIVGIVWISKRHCWYGFRIIASCHSLLRFASYVSLASMDMHHHQNVRGQETIMDVQASFRHPHRHSSTSCLAFSFAVMETSAPFPPPHLPHSLQSFLNLPPATRGPDFYKQGKPSQVLRCLWNPPH